MEKENLLPTHNDQSTQGMMSDKDIIIYIHRQSKLQLRLAIAFTIVAFLYLCFSISRLFVHDTGRADLRYNESTPTVLDEAAYTSKTLVPLEAHIMSKCPDAKVCLKELVLPTMQRVSEKVNFTLSYIGTTTANDGVECKHGAEECLGNIIELCAAHLYPEPRIYLGFVMCLTRDYDEIPQEQLVQDCALEHGIDFDKLNDCSSSDDGFGIGILRESVTRSKEAGVSTSCTVRLNEEVYCVHDEEWKDCPSGPGVNDLVIAIEKLYNSS